MQENGKVSDNLIDILEDLDECLEKITNDVRHSDEPLSKDFVEQTREHENNEVPDSSGNTARD